MKTLFLLIILLIWRGVVVLRKFVVVAFDLFRRWGLGHRDGYHFLTFHRGVRSDHLGLLLVSLFLVILLFFILLRSGSFLFFALYLRFLGVTGAVVVHGAEC